MDASPEYIRRYWWFSPLPLGSKGALGALPIEWGV